MGRVMAPLQGHRGRGEKEKERGKVTNKYGAHDVHNPMSKGTTCRDI